jgi:DNA-binding NtrC family response regulator
VKPLGQSPAFLDALRALEAFARHDLPVLIEGETGTGKEVLSRYLHDVSPRAAKPFVPVHCAALPAELFESEMFGHDRGAFTDAKSDRKGLLRAAEGGTLVLDDISELSLSCQAKLLRPLQEQEVRPVGRDRAERINVRFVATSNRNLSVMVDRGEFRADLFFRLRAGAVMIPPLRERGADAAIIANHFAARFHRTLSPDAMRAAELFDWPGNVRELEMAVARLAALWDGGPEIPADFFTASLLPAARAPLSAKDASFHLLRHLREVEARLAALVTKGLAQQPPSAAEAPEVLDLKEEVARLEVDLIERAIRMCGGNYSSAAQALGIKRSTLWEKVRRRSIGGYGERAA